MSSEQSLCSMTREETIKRLDQLIAYLNSRRGRSLRNDDVEHKVLSSLKGLPISASTLSAISNIQVEDDSSNHCISTNVFKMMEEYDRKYLIAMINLLNREKEIQVQAMQDEAQKENLAQQKRSNKIQIWTLICSIVAALAALYPIIESLIKKMLN